MSATDTKSGGRRGVPGDKAARMRRYLLVFDDDPSLPSGRVAVYEHGKASAQADLDRVRAFVVDQDMAADLGHVDEPTSFGLVGISATPRLASALRRVPRVKSVIAE
jgi:hypothetical protein